MVSSLWIKRGSPPEPSPTGKGDRREAVVDEGPWSIERSVFPLFPTALAHNAPHPSRFASHLPRRGRFFPFFIILHPKPEIKLKIPLPVWQGEKCISQSSFSARSAYWDSRGFFLEASFMEASTPLVASLMGRMVPAPAMQPPGQAMPSRR